MSDTPYTPSLGVEIKQSGARSKSAGKEARSIKRNANRSLEAPAIPDLAKELETEDRVRHHGERSRGPHGAYTDKVKKRVLNLISQGKTLEQIGQTPGLPSRSTLNDWDRNDQDFREQHEARFAQRLDDLAERVTPKLEEIFNFPGFQDELLAETADKLPTLESAYARDGTHKRALLYIMQAKEKANAWTRGIAQIVNNSARLVPRWREDADTVSNVTIFDVNLSGPVKTTNLPGTPDGQNVAALKSGRWGQKLLPSDADGGAR